MIHIRSGACAVVTGCGKVRRMKPTPPTRRWSFSPHLLMRALLVLVVVAPIARFMGAGDLAVFACSALAIVPLAGLMGEATETIASRMGAGIGGLLNATFGNAAELILALVALKHGHQEVVKASLTGSIIGNTLLVLGVAMIMGGVRREKQTFDRAAAAASSTLLLLAALAPEKVLEIMERDRGAGLWPPALDALVSALGRVDGEQVA